MNPEQYLKEHDLKPEFVKTMGWVLEDQRIIIPYYDEEGKLLHCRYRNFAKQVKFDADPGSRIMLYATHKIKNKDFIILCEGEPDCVRLWQEDTPATTAGGVTSLNSKIAEPLRKKRVIVLLDNDKPGQDAVKKYCEILLSIDAIPYIATLPDGCKDVCDYFITGATKDDFADVIAACKPYEEWNKNNEPQEFNILSGEEILKKELPEQEWLLERMIPCEGFTFIVGSEGTGKSFDALTMANAIATGDDWLKTFPVKKQVNVLFIDKESTIRRIQNRMKGLQLTGKGIFYLEYPQWFSLISEEEGQNFSPFALKIQKFVEKNNVGLIVIDSFADVMIGNENAAADTQMFFDGFRQLLPNKSILVLHHANKPSAGMIRTAAQKTRGSTNIMAQAYSAFYVEQIPRHNNEFSFEHIKAGDTEKIKKFKIEMEVHQDIYDKSKTQVIGLKFAGEIEEEEGKELRAEEGIIEILNTQDSIARSDLEDIVTLRGISRATFKKVFDKLKDEKKIETTVHPSDKRKIMISLV